MTQEEIKTTLTNNIKKEKNELKALLACYDIAAEMEKDEDKRFTEIAEKVLKENDFRFPEDNERMQVKKGERILKDDDTFLMSENDKTRYRQIVSESNHAAGLTDKDGYYTSNIRTIRRQAYNTIVNFIIERILPEQIRKTFQDNKLNITYTDRLIEIIRPAIA